MEQYFQKDLVDPMGVFFFLFCFCKWRRGGSREGVKKSMGTWASFNPEEQKYVIRSFCRSVVKSHNGRFNLAPGPSQPFGCSLRDLFDLFKKINK